MLGETLGAAEVLGGSGGRRAGRGQRGRDRDKEAHREGGTKASRPSQRVPDLVSQNSRRPPAGPPPSTVGIAAWCGSFCKPQGRLLDECLRWGQGWHREGIPAFGESCGGTTQDMIGQWQAGGKAQGQGRHSQRTWTRSQHRP